MYNDITIVNLRLRNNIICIKNYDDGVSNKILLSAKPDLQGSVMKNCFIFLPVVEGCSGCFGEGVYFDQCRFKLIGFEPLLYLGVGIGFLVG